jgi:hypothetical protein
MKKAAVPTTAARGTAVSSRRITAVQSVYIPVSETKALPSSQQSRPFWMSRSRSPRLCPNPPAFSAVARRTSALLAAAVLPLGLAPAQAGVQFENCVRGLDGSITCDTVPTGDTLLTDKAAQFGLFQNASPGWNEFNPFQGYDEDLGDDPY